VGFALPRSHPGRSVKVSAGTTAKSPGWGGLILGLTIRALTSPSLARDLLRVAWRFRARRWFLRLPFLPVPSREYTRWRMYTAYGDEQAVPPVEDVIRYARWAGRT
jgi:hypothetical protein